MEIGIDFDKNLPEGKFAVEFSIPTGHKRAGLLVHRHVCRLEISGARYSEARYSEASRSGCENYSKKTKSYAAKMAQRAIQDWRALADSGEVD